MFVSNILLFFCNKKPSSFVQRASEPENKEDHWGPDKGNVTIDDFDLLKVIGRGSFGKVMQVRHKGSGNIFAMKILRKEAIAARGQVSFHAFLFLAFFVLFPPSLLFTFLEKKPIPFFLFEMFCFRLSTLELRGKY